MVRKCIGQDSEQTPEMRQAEKYNERECDQIFEKLFKNHGDRGWTWCATEYIMALQVRKDAAVVEASQTLDEAKSLEIMKHMTLAHYWQRIIAFYHQQIKLMEQGKGVLELATENDKLISKGRG